MSDLIPRSPKRKRQPTAACMREQLALSADRIIELQARMEPRWFVESIVPGHIEIIDSPRTPWWRRIFRKS